MNVFPTNEVDLIPENAYRMMTILNPLPESDDINVSQKEIELLKYIRVCIRAKGDQEEVEGSTFDTTIVFSSLGLLWNAYQCEKLEWRVMCSSDGTDSVAANNWQLLTMGAFNISKHCKKQFRPFFYVFCPGERQECFGLGVLAFLKYTRYVFGIVNIDFRAGAVSDCSEVFTNIYDIAFPNTQKTQCYTHITRKVNNRGKGNGDYIRDMKNKKFVNTAKEDIRNLHECITQKQFKTYAKLVRVSWMAAGEQTLANKFFKTYIENEKFNTWTVSSSCVHGFFPDNNPTERANSEIKGTSMFDGLLKKGHQLGIMLNQEFPSMIYWSCIDRIGLDRYNYLLDEGSIFQENSNIYNDLIKYYDNFRYSRDSKVVSSSTTDNKIEILVNTEDFLGRHITLDRQKNMRKDCWEQQT